MFWNKGIPRNSFSKSIVHVYLARSQIKGYFSNDPNASLWKKIETFPRLFLFVVYFSGIIAIIGSILKFYGLLVFFLLFLIAQIKKIKQDQTFAVVMLPLLVFVTFISLLIMINFYQDNVSIWYIEIKNSTFKGVFLPLSDIAIVSQGKDDSRNERMHRPSSRTKLHCLSIGSDVLDIYEVN